MSEPWKPREHDHLVEPLFGGLQHPAHTRRSSKALWVGVAIVFALLVARIVTLLL
jgi:hypothetical protein